MSLDWNNHAFSQILKKYGQLIQVNPKERLVTEGKFLQHVYFIRKGCLRSFVLNDGKEI